MATYTERVQTVLTPAQYERLLAYGERVQKPLSVLIREAIEQTYFVEQDRQQRLSALETLLTLEAPIGDWEEMEAEIERGALDG